VSLDREVRLQNLFESGTAGDQQQSVRSPFALVLADAMC